MEVRRLSNIEKMEWLAKWVPRGSKVLDVGCGQGGDVHKWRKLGATVTGVDPNPLAIQEARRRCSISDFRVGNVRDIRGKFDVICYNFSLQYETPENYEYIKTLLNPGGIIVGIVPDPVRILAERFKGIHVRRINPGHISVFIEDTPYYALGPVSEPLFDLETFKKHFSMIETEEYLCYLKFVAVAS